MELKHIKELMAAMGRTGTKRIVLKKEGFEIEIERDSIITSQEDILDLEQGREFQTIRKAPEALPKSPEIKSNASNDAPGTFINSPMVGTFYAAPSPDDPSFIKVGDKVDKNSVVCIVEAMKVMNEIKAGVSGTVVEILVDSATPVEFGTKLFRIV
jgi:acetyl-CoA carboxylase biotin carboxyl carrier protein